MEGGTAAMLTSSGQAANFYAVMNIAEEGDHIVCSSALYGGTYNLYAHTIRKMGAYRHGSDTFRVCRSSRPGNAGRLKKTVPKSAET